MSKMLKRITVLILALIMMIPAVNVEAAKKKENSMTLDITSKAYIGEYLTWSTSIIIDGNYVSWWEDEDRSIEISDEKVITYNSDYDELRAVGAGKATITAKGYGLTATSEVEVFGPSFKAGEEYNVTNITIPANTKISIIAGSFGDKATFSSSDTKVLAADLISYDTSYITLYGKKAGSATITGKGSNGTAKIRVKVVERLNISAVNQVTWSEYNKKKKLVTEYLSYTLVNDSASDIIVLPNVRSKYNESQIMVNEKKEFVIKAGESKSIKVMATQNSSSYYEKTSINKMPTKKVINSNYSPYVVIKLNDMLYETYFSWETGYLSSLGFRGTQSYY